MLFNSVAFLIFFLIVHQVYWRIQRDYRKYWLLFASMVFYGYWSWSFLPHFLLIVLINFAFVRSLLARRNKALFILSIVLNLTNLIFFKYFNSLLNMFGEWMGFQQALVLKQELGIILPLAISFYTFQIIAFAVDVWRGEVKEITLSRYAFFIMFFPQLIAGPIMRHSDFLHQIDNAELKEGDTPSGLYLLAQGTIKKVLLADEIAKLINPVWANPEQYDQAAVIIAVVGFHAQIYCDFSGYTDMARGLARLLGYRIPENFYFPFLSTSFSNLWKRWHVTLSTWIRDYLYIPLGGSHCGPTRHSLNMVISFTLAGIWHGNTYPFLIWGFLNGVFIVAERYLGGAKPSRSPAILLFRFLIVTLGSMGAIVFFRGENMQKIYEVFSGMFENRGESLESWAMVLQLTAFGWGFQVLQYYRSKFEHLLLRHWRIILPLLGVILFYMIARIEKPAAEFIYFQF